MSNDLNSPEIEKKSKALKPVKVSNKPSFWKSLFKKKKKVVYLPLTALRKIKDFSKAQNYFDFCAFSEIIAELPLGSSKIILIFS